MCKISIKDVDFMIILNYNNIKNTKYIYQKKRQFP